MPQFYGPAEGSASCRSDEAASADATEDPVNVRGHAKRRPAPRRTGARAGEPLTVIDARAAFLPPLAAALVRLLGGTLRLRVEGADALVPLLGRYFEESDLQR